jgi:hypothetical protein
MKNDMDREEIKALMIEVVENHFCCSGTECEARFLRPRIIRIEQILDGYTEWAAGKLNRISRKLEIEP